MFFTAPPQETKLPLVPITTRISTTPPHARLNKLAGHAKTKQSSERTTQKQPGTRIRPVLPPTHTHTRYLCGAAKRAAHEPLDQDLGARADGVGIACHLRLGLGEELDHAISKLHTTTGI